MSKQELLLFIVQVVSAFLELEKFNVMHLDLKPENILVASDGYYKICDFGCSQLAEKSRITRYNNDIFGTHNYMAP